MNQTKNDILKVFVLAIFIGFAVGSAHAQLDPDSSVLPPPEDITALINTGESGVPMQIKTGGLGINGALSVTNANFQQNFTNILSSSFFNAVTAQQSVDFYGGLKADNVDVGGNLMIEGIYDASEITLSKSVSIPSLKGSHPVGSGGLPWGDRVCFRKAVSGGTVMELVLCPSGI